MAEVLASQEALLKERITRESNFLPAVEEVSRVVEQIRLHSDISIAVIFLSDGRDGDGDGHPNKQKILHLIAQMAVPFHTIVFGTDIGKQDTELQEMADSSPGGACLQSTNREQLLQNFSDIQARLK